MTAISLSPRLSQIPRNVRWSPGIGPAGYSLRLPRSAPMPRVPDVPLPSSRSGPGVPDGEEAVLIAALRRGEDTAFASLLREHGAPLLATARRMLGCEEDARDALQDAFLSAFRAVHAFEGKSRLGTWLHRITVNSVLMKLRSRKRACERRMEDLVPHFTDDGHHVEPPCPFSDAAVRALQSSESRMILWRAIEQLPDAYREVIVLRDIEGLSTEEAGTHLGITANAIKIRLHRARQALRTLLGDCSEDLSP